MSEVVKLLPCPFCGAPAEVDTSRGFRALRDGRMHSGVSIYCSSYCHVELMLSRVDLPEYDDDQLFAMLTENWNTRAPDPFQAEQIERLTRELAGSSAVSCAKLAPPSMEPTMKLSKAQRLHRRAQRAEGAVKAAEYQLGIWDRVYSDPRRDGSPFAQLVIRSIRKALSRAALGASHDE